MNDIVTSRQPDDFLPAVTAADSFLSKIRPEWKAKSLIERVNRILPVDPSSACQRLFNAAIHDLRVKVVVAGLDIAEQAAKMHKLPPVTKAEDVENYSTDRLIDLAYRMGLLSRKEWKKIKRCYDIRRDLEHEDDEYEADIEDCVYIFKSAIEIVLARDPVELLKVTDVKEAIEEAKPQFPEEQFLDEYGRAPEVRQLEIMRFLVSSAMDEGKPDIVRTNAVAMIGHLEAVTHNTVKIGIGKDLQKKIGKGVASTIIMKVAHVAGVTPYLKQNSRKGYYDSLRKRLAKIGHEWRKYEHHGKILGELEDVGGLVYSHSDEIAQEIMTWMVLCYLGEPGGYGMGANRAVFNSNTAAPIIKRLIKAGGDRELAMLKAAGEDKRVKFAMGRKKAIAKRYEDLLDLAGDV